MEGVMDRGRARAHHTMPRWARRTLIALGVLVVLAIVFRIVLDPIAGWAMRRKLNDLQGYKADFASVHISLLPPGTVVRRFKIIEEPGGDWKHPLMYAERTQLTVDGRALLHGHLVARARIDAPKISFVQKQKKDAKRKAMRVPDLAAQLRAAAPLDVERVEILDGELLVRDDTERGQPEVWLHNLQLSAENITTREALAKGRPTTMSASAKLGKTGDLTMFLSADPFAKGLTFAGRSALRGYDARELAEVIAAKTDMTPTSGTINVYTEFKAKNGAITGGVKPVLENIEIASVDRGLWDRFKAWFVDTALDVLSDDVPGRDAVATIIPIKGTVDDPKAQILPTALGIVRNAFVQGISSSFAHLPPRTSDKKQGVVKQTVNALKEDKGPPAAQPESK